MGSGLRYAIASKYQDPVLGVLITRAVVYGGFPMVEMILVGCECNTLKVPNTEYAQKTVQVLCYWVLDSC